MQLVHALAALTISFLLWRRKTLSTNAGQSEGLIQLELTLSPENRLEL